MPRGAQNRTAHRFEIIARRYCGYGDCERMYDALLNERNTSDTRRHTRRLPCVVLTVALGCLPLAACAPPASRSPASPHATPSATPSALATATPSAGPQPGRLSACPGAVRFSSLPVITRVPGADDLAVAPDGSIWVSDAHSVLEHRTISGALLQTVADPRGPEGIVVLGDGSLLLAEQGPDRVVQLQPATLSTRTVLQLTLRGGALGIDGIAVDTTSGNVLVPDSPNGTLLAVPLEGGPVARLAGGLGRPVGVAASGDGSFAVAAENSSGLYRVPAGGGAAQPSGGVVQGDDVVASGPLVYVTSLATHQLLAVDTRSGQSRVLVDADSQPQGLARLPDGDLILSDSATGAVALVHACG